jgi:hypothetical protein
MEQVRELEKNSEKEDYNIKKAFELKKKNTCLTSLLKNKIGEKELEKHPQEAEYYLKNDEEKVVKLNEEKDEIAEQLNESTGRELREKLERERVLEQRIEILEKKKSKGFLARYLVYISNNERL